MRTRALTIARSTLVLAVLALAHTTAGQEHLRLQACVDSCIVAESYGSYDAALGHLEEAWSIAAGLKDSTAMANVLVRRSGIRMVKGDYNSSLTDLQEALRIYEARKDEAGIATVFTSIGSIHYYDRNYGRAQQYYLRSLDIQQRIGTPSDVAKLFGNIGSVLEEMEKPDSALVYHQRHLAIRLAFGQSECDPICYSNLGVCYDKLGMPDSAIHYLEASLELLSTRPGAQDQPRSYSESMLGLARLHAGQPKMAIALCRDALATASSLGELPLQEQCYNCLYRAYQALGSAPEALRMFERYIAVRDSISGEQRAKELIRIELTYNFERQQLADSLVRLDEERRADFAYQQRLSKERDQKRILLFGAIAVLILAGALGSRLRYMQRSRKLVQRERDRSDVLLRNILPAAIADELKANGRAQAREVDDVSILFTDFHDFTELSERMAPQELVAEIDACFRAFDAIATRHGLEKIKTIGDAYMCAGGLPDPRAGSARDTVLAALAMQQWLLARSVACSAQGLPSFRMRAGIHTGPVVAGIVGESKFQYDIWGDTVNIAARMESAGAVDEVNISEATFALVKEEADLHFSPRGRVQAKGKGELSMFFVRSNQVEAQRT